jgi:TldD protein
LSTGGDFAEVFEEERDSTSVMMVGGLVESAVAGTDSGVGVRVFAGLRSVYAYTTGKDEDTLIHAALSAAQALPGARTDRTVSLCTASFPGRHPIRLYPGDVALGRKVEVMRRARAAAAAYDPIISQVRVRYMDEDQRVQVANTDGVVSSDRRVRTRLMIDAVATWNGENQSGFYGPGASKGFEFLEDLDVEFYACEAARIAATMARADRCPPGRMPVIIDNEFGGVIFHEACGHALEATSVAKGNSVFCGKLGQQVARPIVSAVDDGTIPNAWGSMNMDDEGTPMRRNVLIEHGVLKSNLIDRLNARRMAAKTTGSSRRESYRFAPTSRMTNTFICPGDLKPEEIIADTEYGLYAKHMGGGSVVPATGAFNFAVNEGSSSRTARLWPRCGGLR